jgi:toxin YoeB
MNLTFAEEAWADYIYWQREDKRMLKKINELIKDIKRMPFEGIGNPELLKHDWAGYWSRRINQEHRLVYKIKDNSVLIAQCRYHYSR